MLLDLRSGRLNRSCFDLRQFGVGGGGGGDGPVALVYADFKNGTYRIGGVSKALGEVFVEDAENWTNWDSSSTVIAGVGLTTGDASNTGPVLSAAAKTALLGGYVVVMSYELVSNPPGQTAIVDIELLDLPDYAASWGVTAAMGISSTDVGVYDYDSNTAFDVETVGAHKLAAIVCSDGLYCSHDGDANVVIATPQDNSGATDIGITVSGNNDGDARATITEIEFFSLSDYDASDLPALSGGGESDPTPLISADFKNDAYALNGAAKVLADVWEYNENWGPGFDPELHVVPGTGLSTEFDTSTGPVLTAEALALVVDGFVAVITCHTAAMPGEGDRSRIQLSLADMDTSYELKYDESLYPDAVEDRGQVNDADGAGPVTLAGSVDGTHKVAVRIDPAELAGSIAGGDAGTIAVTSSGVADVLILQLNRVGGATCNVEKIEFFALSDYSAGDLPALSS